MADLRLRRARLPDEDALVDIEIAGDRVTRVAPSDPDDARGDPGLALGAPVWDLAGRIVLPALVEPHAHLDKTFSGPAEGDADLTDAIDAWKARKGSISRAEHRARAERALRMALRAGVRALRSHVDVEPGGGTAALEELLELRASLRPAFALQLVALGDPGGGRAADAAMRAALELGVDAVGGAPALAGDPERCIAAALDLAEAYDRPVDLHVDEHEDGAFLTLETLADAVLERGLEGRVVAGHACALAFAGAARAERVMARVAEARIGVVTLPSCNLNLLGRGGQPAPRGVTRVRELRAAGATVAAGGDNARDPFNPFGRYDPLLTAHITAHAAHLATPAGLAESLRMVTEHAAALLDLPDAGPREGARADLLVLDARDPGEIVPAVPERGALILAGRPRWRAERRESWGEVPGWAR